MSTKRRKNTTFANGTTFIDGVWTRTMYIRYVFPCDEYPRGGCLTKTGGLMPFSRAHLFDESDQELNKFIYSATHQTYVMVPVVQVPIKLTFNESDVEFMASLCKDNPEQFAAWMHEHMVNQLAATRDDES